MKQRALAQLARLLWPYIRPYVLIEIEDAQKGAQSPTDAHIKASERLRRKYVGDT